MSLFKSFKRKSNQPSKNESEIFNQIFLTICQNNSDAAAELKSLCENTKEFANKNQQYYSDRMISTADEPENSLRWIGAVEILMKYSYASEFDYCCELEDFVHFTNKLVTVQSKNLGFSQDDFDEDGDITQWSEQLDEIWSGKGFCLGCIDIDSDSYLVFAAEISTLQKLRELAKSINRRIDYAKNC